MIPKQLQKDTIRFCFVNCKVPIGEEWQKEENTYKHDDPQLLKRIADGGNYGVVGGYGNIMIVDADKQSIVDAFSIYPETLTVQTGNGTHLYYYVPGLEKSYSLQEETSASTPDKLIFKNIGHITSKGRMVVAPGCKHYDQLADGTYQLSGKKYEIVKNLPIQVITEENVRATIKPFLAEKIREKYAVQAEAKKTDTSNLVNIPISQIADKMSDLKKMAPGYRGHNPSHPNSKSRMDLAIDTFRNWWVCGACADSGYGFGNSAYLIALNEGILQCHECKKGGLRGDKFLQVKKLAIEKYGVSPDVFNTKTEKKNKKDDDKEKTKVTSKIIQDGKLWEQIYDPTTNTSKYLHYDILTAEIKTLDDITINGIKHLPINDDLLERQAVILPTGTEEYYTTEILIEEIRTYIKKYLDISDEHLQKATWYVLLTWIYDNLHTIPYLRALGDYGSGKTRYEDVIGGISYKPTFVGGSVRSAPIYRVIDLWRGTAVFDEFTLKESDEAQDIIQILNCGYQRGKPVLRCKDGNYSVVECFDPFCPKILSSRKGFKDLALESRCITEIIRETGRKDIPIDLGEKFYKERSTLQNKLLLWRFRNWNEIKPNEDMIIDFGNVQPRIKQTFLPFTILFLKDENELRNFIATVKKYNTAQVEESSTSTYGLVVNIFLKLKKDGGSVVTSKDIRNELVNEHNFDEKTSANTVGRYLKPLGFTNKLIKNQEGKVSRSILVDEMTLSRLVARYVLPEDQEKLPELKTICTDAQTKLDGGKE